MRNAKKTLSLMMVAIFTTFIVLSGVPAGAVTSAAAKTQVTKATAAVVKVEKTVKVATFVPATAQAQLNTATKEVAKVKNLGKTYKTTYTKLVARNAAVAKKIAARKLVIANLAKTKSFTDADKAVTAAEKATNADEVDLVGDAAALATAQGTITAALELIVKLDKNSPNYKGLMARVDAANGLIVKAMDEITANEEAARIEADAKAKLEAAIKAAETAVAAVEAAPLATAADLTAALELGKTAATAVAAVTDAEKAAAFTARLKVMADKGLAVQAALAPAKIASVSAVDGTITVNFDKKPLTTVAAVDFTVTKSVAGATAVAVTPSAVTVVSDTVVTIAVPAVAGLFTTDQAVVYNVAYTTATAVAAPAYTVAKLPGFQVVSAAAINSREIKVVYNYAVNTATAEDPSNYTVKIDNAVYAKTFTATVQDDGVSVILLLDKTLPIHKNASYRTSVSGVLDTTYTAVTSYTGTYAIFADSTAPASVTASKRSTGVFRLTFNEPVLSVGTVKIDGTDFTSGGWTVSETAGLYTLTSAATLGTDAAAVGTHSVVVYGAADPLGNTASMLTTTYTVVNDTTAPAVTAIKAKSTKVFEVIFSKAVTAPVAANFVVVKGSYTFPSTAITSIVADADDSYAYDVTITSDSTNPLYDTNTTTTALGVTVKNFIDTNGVFGATYTGNVTLAKDTVGPALLSSKIISSTGNIIVVPFNEDLNTVNPANVTVTKDGVKITPLVVTIDGTDASKLKIDLGVVAITDGTYTVEDIDGNANASFSANYVSTATADSVWSTATATVLAGNIIQVAYGTKMTNTAVDPTNYVLDGVQLPTGTSIYFTSTAKDTVLIELPSGYVSSNASSKMLTINTNVTTDLGQVVETAGYLAINQVLTGFADNTKPVLTSACYVLNASGDTTTNVIKLTFNEAMGAIVAAAGDDLKVQIAGVTVTVSKLYLNGSNHKEIFVRLATAINVAQAGTVKVLAAGDQVDTTMGLVDAATPGNTATANTIINVATSIIDSAVHAAAQL
jgi:hypothetical protein